jgi:hypothetical protein
MKRNSKTLEERLDESEAALSVALAENVKLKSDLVAANARTAPAPKSQPAAPAAETPPAAPTRKQKIAAAFAKAAAIDDPYKRALAFGEARRLMESLS